MEIEPTTTALLNELKRLEAAGQAADGVILLVEWLALDDEDPRTAAAAAATAALLREGDASSKHPGPTVHRMCYAFPNGGKMRIWVVINSVSADGTVNYTYGRDGERDPLVEALEGDPVTAAKYFMIPHEEDIRAIVFGQRQPPAPSDGETGPDSSREGGREP